MNKNQTAALKGIAICLMLWHHLFYFGVPKDAEPFDIGTITHCLGCFGNMCVSFFVFISGYGLAAGYSTTNPPSPHKFVLSRLIKFYFNFWCIFIIFIPINYALNSEAHIALPNLLGDFLGLSCHSNVDWWFNFLILTFYLIFPLFYQIIGNKTLSIFGVALSFFLAVNAEGNFFKILFYSFPFSAGIALYTYKNEISSFIDTLKPFPAFILFACSFILFSAMRQFNILPILQGWTMDGFIVTSAALSLISFSKWTNCSYIVLSFLGRHSGNIFYFHTFLYFNWFPKFIYYSKSPIITFLTLLSISLIVSIIIESIKHKSGISQYVFNLTH